MSAKSKNIISLSGRIGSGKSEISRFLSRELGFEVCSTGKIQREIASQKNLSPLELNNFSMSNRQVDDRLDGYLRELNETGDGLVVDSRLAWHFIPGSFKVYATVKPEVGARRVFEAGRKEENHATREDTLKSNGERQKLENERFLKLYGIDCSNPENYDLVLDTSEITAEEAASRIIEAFRSRPNAPVR